MDPEYLSPRQDPQEVAMQAATYGWTTYPQRYRNAPNGSVCHHDGLTPLLMVWTILFLIRYSLSAKAPDSPEQAKPQNKTK